MSATEPTPEQRSFLVRQRVGRLATVSAAGEPYTVPVCFAYEGSSLYIALDEKPKSVGVRGLKRVRNILENPRVSLVFDRYAEDWEWLAYLMVRGSAVLIEPDGPDEREHARAIRLLRGKYHQYEGMRIEEQPVIGVRLDRVTGWGDFTPQQPQHSFLDTARRRRSVRRYVEKPVPQAAVEEMLEAARWAPSPHGTQPWRFAVVESERYKRRLADAMGEEWRHNLEMDGQDKEVVERRLEGSRRRLLDAPVLILVCLYSGDLDLYPDENRQHNEMTMAVQSLGAATQNLLLAAAALGLDTSWMCAPLFSPAAVKKALSLDEDLIPHALITVGYAVGDPVRRKRRSLEELVIFRDNTGTG